MEVRGPTEMVNRNAISQTLSQLLLRIQGQDSEQVQLQSLLVIENSNASLDPSLIRRRRTQGPCSRKWRRLSN